jgi:uncharacterized protein with von Willebrand factor type A (vWA) domain
MKIVKKADIPYSVYGAWEVWPDGTIKSIFRNPVGRESRIEIMPEILSSPDLLLVMHAEGSVDNWNDFMNAFFEACRLAKIKTIKNFQTGFQ